MLTITHENVPQQTAFARKRRKTLRAGTFGVFLAPICLLGLLGGQLAAQDANEALGPKDNAAKGASTPLLLEMKTLRSSVRPELAGVHPRVYFTGKELEALRVEAHGAQKTWWSQQLLHIRALQGPPPPPPAEKRRAQNDVAFAMAEAAFAYKMEGDPKYLAAAKLYMDAAVSYDVWGYSFSKPNVDLAAGHLLYGMGFAYDLLYNDLSPAERERYRNKIARQGHLLYEFFAPRPGRSWAYSQNHTFIPMAGLGVAAYAVYGEVPEAKQWAALARAIYSKVLATYSKDGYYYEGFEYWIFSTPWIIHYLDAQKHATGEDLFDQPGLRKTHLYAAHSLTPGGQMMFDFGDVFAGPVTRAKIGDDYERSHPDGHFESNYNLLYDLAARYNDSEIQGVADWMNSMGHTGQEEWWTLAWRNPRLKAMPIEKVEPWHHFPDHDVVFWRSGWDAQATAIAFKCGPPEEHSATDLIAKMPDWHTEQGHVHPDVNSFILWAHGQYLTGDSGYAGVPLTIEHNTLLVDGHGQGHEGKGHDAWAGFSYEQMNKARITHAHLNAQGFDIEGEGAGVYDSSLGLKRYLRRISMTVPGSIEVNDEVESNAPHVFTEVLHSDTKVEQMAGQRYRIQIQGAGLDVFLRQPPQVNSKVEPNVVMGPGRPGSVDKGSLEPRGERLVVSTAKATTSTQFAWVLTFK
jgi:phage-related protein